MFFILFILCIDRDSVDIYIIFIFIIYCLFWPGKATWGFGWWGDETTGPPSAPKLLHANWQKPTRRPRAKARRKGRMAARRATGRGKATEAKEKKEKKAWHPSWKRFFATVWHRVAFFGW